MSKISREELLEMAREAAEHSVVAMRENAIAEATTPPSELENAPQFDKTECFLERFAYLVLEEKHRQTNYVAWKHDCNALLISDFELWVPNCPHCGKPRQAQPPTVSADDLVAAEREACAKECDKISDDLHPFTDAWYNVCASASAIRARGEK